MHGNLHVWYWFIAIIYTKYCTVVAWVGMVCVQNLVTKLGGSPSWITPYLDPYLKTLIYLPDVPLAFSHWCRLWDLDLNGFLSLVKRCCQAFRIPLRWMDFLEFIAIKFLETWKIHIHFRHSFSATFSAGLLACYYQVIGLYPAWWNMKLQTPYPTLSPLPCWNVIVYTHATHPFHSRDINPTGLFYKCKQLWKTSIDVDFIPGIDRLTVT